MFIPLNVHSGYSLGWGVDSLEILCRTAKEKGCPAIALTDINNLYGLIFFIQTARQFDITPIVGAEVSTPDGIRATLLVRNYQGYKNLSHIITDRHIKENFSFKESLKERHEGLVVLTDNLTILQNFNKQLEYLYAEISPGYIDWKLLRLARENHIPVVATPRSFWSSAESYQLHLLNRAISLNTALSELKPGQYAPKTALFPTEEVLREACSIVPEAVDNSLIIGDICHWTPDFGVVYPEVESGNNGNVNKILREKAYSGALWRYGEVTSTISDRIEHEMRLIEERGFASVFLVVEEIVRQASRTCGRGSAAASIISYCLGITNVDPIRYNLFFERFINQARVDPPDIDIDFAWDERDDILNYVFNRYGETRAAMVSNHVTFQKRAAIREIAKVYGMPDGEISAMTKRLSHYGDYMGIDPGSELKKGGLPDPWSDIFRYAESLCDVPRHISVHCGGVVITPGETADWVPTQVAAKGVRVIHWEKDQTEDSGLVKIDLLGNRSLAVIRDAKAAVKSHFALDLDYSQKNPQDDPSTQTIISQGDTMGVFYIESPATRLLQKKAGMGDYDHTVLHSSIIRPAANKFINLYLRRLKGESWQPLHPLLADLLDDNYGIMVYQEDVTRVAMKLAGFPLAEADELRKILSKKHKRLRLLDLMKKFYDGARAQGAEDPAIDAIWEMIMSFAGYSFCKPHSASYAIVSYESAYLRAHYPAEFIAAVISNQGGFYSTFAYISEARRMGLNILAPDINQSDKTYIGRNSAVRIGFMQIKGLNDETINRIIAARRDRLFADFDDCWKRACLTPADARLLILSGSFDALESTKTRPELLWQVTLKNSRDPKEQELIPREQANHSARKMTRAGNNSLFTLPVLSTPKVPQYDERTLLLQEVETLGFLASRHPLELYRERIAHKPVVRACELNDHIGRRIDVAGWLVTAKVVPTSKDEPMEFVTFEDTTGLIETVFFPDAFRNFSRMLSFTKPYRLTGRVMDDFGALTMSIERVEFL